MAKLTTEEFIAAIKELSVLELNDLVKACEEEFGVSAAAGVVMAGPAAGPAAEEKDEFDVELTEVGAEKVKVIKVVREITGLELKEKGVEADLDTIEKDIIDRDYRDMNREISPLKQAVDAVLIDSSDMTIDEVVEKMISLV